MGPKEHPTRTALLARIRAQPGIPTVALSAGANAGTTRHHLRALERAGLVRAKRVGRHLRWGASSAPAAAPHPPARVHLLALVAREPGLTQSQLAARAGLAPATVSHHVARLEGLVEARREGRTVRLFALGRHQDL